MSGNQLQILMTKQAALKYAEQVLSTGFALTPSYEELQDLITDAFHAGCQMALRECCDLMEFPSLGGTPVDSEIQKKVLDHRNGI